MYLTKAQSLTVALGALVLFFVGGITYMRLSQPRFITTTANAPITEPTTAPSDATPVAGGSNFVLENFHRKEMKDGRTIWEISAIKGQYYPETNTAQLDSPSLLLYRPNGEVVTLQADAATITLTGASLTRAEIKGKVTVIYSEKVTIKTELAVYEKERNLVTAPGEVTITSAQLDIVGRELTAKLDKNEFTLARDVESTVKKRALERGKHA